MNKELKDISVHILFEEQVEKSPDAIALKYDGKVLTYKSLSEQSNKFANYLISIGIKTGDPVGICLPQSFELAISIIGVLKAGAAYVPLDPDYPVDRLNLMVAECQTSLIISNTDQNFVFHDFNGQFVNYDAVAGMVQGLAPLLSQSADDPNQVAHCIFTSGSTGKPKGVEISHRSLSYFLQSVSELAAISSKDCLLSISRVSFDAFGFDLFAPLINGGTVVLTSSVLLIDYQALARAVNKEITILFTGPFIWKKLLETGWKGHPDLKIMSIGEALPFELGKQLLKHGKEVWNMYGPTETTILATCSKILPTDAFITIGHALGQTKLYVLDDDLQKIAPGGTGELYIGGPGVALGYINQPELTNERFLKDPFSAAPDAHMYKSGDMVRESADGRLEYIGRKDNQIKIRGNRVEPGDIENAILTHGQVSHAAAIPHNTMQGETEIVAFIQLNPENVLSGQDLEVTKSEIRELCIKILPLHMVPAKFVFVDRFPVTPNGKIDRKALSVKILDKKVTDGKSVTNPAIDKSRFQSGLLKMWGKVLNQKNVRLTDNFFEFGGDSVSGLQLLGLIQKKFGIKLQLTALLQAQTPAKMIEILEKSTQKEILANIVALQPKGQKTPLFCLPAGRGDYIGFSNLVKFLNPDRPVYYITPMGADGKKSSLRTIDQLATYYLADIKRIQPLGPYIFCGMSFGGLVVYEIAQQLYKESGEKPTLVLLDTFVPGSYYFKTTNPDEKKEYNYGKITISRFLNRKRKIDIKLLKKFFNKNSIILWDNICFKLFGVDYLDFSINFKKKYAEKHHTFLPYPGNVSVIKALKKAAEDTVFYESDNGWKKYVTGNLNYVGAEVEHFDMLKDNGIPQVAEALNKILEKY